MKWPRFSPSGPAWVIIICVIIYEFAFGISWGYGAWLYIPEIMPLRVRGKAVGLCTFINWGVANVMSAFLSAFIIATPSLGGSGGNMILFGVMAVIAVPFTVMALPETRGLGLEEVGARFQFESGEFWKFVRGNVRYGSGILGFRPGATN